MLHIAICDDTPEELSMIAALTEEYISSHGIDAKTVEFSHPDTLLQATEKTTFDIYLLDIIMPMLTGADLRNDKSYFRIRRMKVTCHIEVRWIIMFMRTLDDNQV